MLGGSKRLGKGIENPLKTAAREFEEEVGYSHREVTSVDPIFIGNIILEEGNRVRIGFLYEIEVPTLNPGHEYVPKDPKIARVQQFDRNNVIALFKDDKTIHKPDFNREAILY